MLPIPDGVLEEGDPPYYHPGIGSPEHEYLIVRRRALHGPLPERVVIRTVVTLPAPDTYAELMAGTGHNIQAFNHHGVRGPAPQPAA